QDLGDHLIATEQMKQSYPTCERCSSPIEIIMSRQWSIRILEQKEQLLEFIQPLQIHPSFMKKRLINWISGLSWDWIISRQRQYGIAIPAWICDTCESIKIADTSQLPIRLDEMTSESCRQSNCQGELQPDGDIFDTWMTSSLSPVILNELYSLSGPMSFRSQAHEIIRTWAFYTIVKGLLKGENLPWDHLLISGWGLGFKEKGKRGIKASKSSGSGFDPLDIIAEIGADPFRYWCASARLGKDQYLNEAILNRGKKLTTKLYNATKIILLLADNSQGPETEPPAESRLQEILHRMEILQGRYEGCMSEFEYSDALTAAELDFWNVFCQADIEFFKSNSLGDMWNNLFEIHLMYLRMFAPFLPFITEYLYQIMAEYLSAKGTNSTLAPSIHMRY
ncbi:MAG: class I tRNA ligase family protein, partial [Candidatus Kariarchaeaceae archaeon]